MSKSKLEIITNAIILSVYILGVFYLAVVVGWWILFLPLVWHPSSDKKVKKTRKRIRK